MFCFIAVVFLPFCCRFEQRPDGLQQYIHVYRVFTSSDACFFCTASFRVVSPVHFRCGPWAHTDDRRHVPPPDGYVCLCGVDRDQALGRENGAVDEDLRRTSPADQAVVGGAMDEAERGRGGGGSGGFAGQTV